MSGLGFKEVYNVKGGIKSWDGVKAAGPKELNLNMIKEDETPAGIIMIAYAMETASQAFYRETKEKTDDSSLNELLATLVDVEEKHKKMLEGLLSKVESADKDLKTLKEKDSGSTIMEGGFDVKGFMKENAAFLDSVENVVELAMTLETQSLDLYLRFAEKSGHQETKDVLFTIAEEEKGHLKSLGKLL